MALRADNRPVPLRPATDGADRELDELDLARTWLRGDREAADALWTHFAPLVRGILARAFGPGAENEDALQEIFLRIFHKGRTLREPASLRSFVVAVTVHYLRSDFRKRRLRRLVRLAGWREMPQPEGAVSQPAAALALRSLYRALDRLSARERLAFGLRFFEGAELAEAAALTGVSLATFKRTLAAAKRRLWELTGEDPWLAPYLGSNEGLRRDEGNA